MSRENRWQFYHATGVLPAARTVITGIGSIIHPDWLCPCIKPENPDFLQVSSLWIRAGQIQHKRLCEQRIRYVEAGWPSYPEYQQYLPRIADPEGVEPSAPPPGFNIARIPDSVVRVGSCKETIESDDEDEDIPTFLTHSNLISPPTANNNASAPSMPALQSNSSSSSTDTKPSLNLGQFRYRQRVIASIDISDNEEDVPIDEHEEEETFEEMRARVLRDLTDTPSPPPMDLIQPLEVYFFTFYFLFSFLHYF